MRVLSQHAIFTDRQSETFYLWAGATLGDRGPDYSSLWRFTPDNRGGGQWDTDAPSDQSVFISLEATESMAFASSHDAGFAFGGKVLDEDGKSQDVSALGFVMFNFTTKDWAHNESVPYSYDGSIWGASATFVEKYGSRGIIVILGGLQRAGQQASGHINWDTIYMYDVAEQKWYSQKTSGPPPSGRHHHCAVGISSSDNDGSYEM